MSPSHCRFLRDGDIAVCQACGRVVRQATNGRIVAACRAGVAEAPKHDAARPADNALVGSWLAWLLKKLAGVDELPGCTCRSKARQMNLWGVAGCWPRVGLIVSWLQEEAEKRNLRFWAAGARCLVYAAILLAAVEWAFRPRPAGNKR